MRILWSSNSPFVATGYGQQTAVACRHLKDMGHDMAILAFYGLEGSRVDWGDIPIYPNNPRDWGIAHAPMFYKDWKADIFVTLVDAWVLGALHREIRWVPWLPCDHDPVPPQVIEVLKKSVGLVKPITMTKFGQKQLANNGIESYMIPHSVNCESFIPNLDWRKQGRDKYGWEDKFVIGCVGTNHDERKNWVAMLKAVKIFSKMHPGKIIFYMHTNPLDERGINLIRLRADLDIEDITKFPSQTDMVVGIPTDAMARMYNVLDVFLLPSKGEGFGIPIVEAEACGVPVITTKCTGQEELMDGGWFIEDLKPTWTKQSSWQFECDPEEIVIRLQSAWQAKKDGSMIDRQKLARSKALEYDDKVIYRDYWPGVLADIEKRIKAPKNMEGIQEWRRAFIPRTCLPRRVLDVGCGLTAPYYDVLKHLGDYTGIDNRFEQDELKGSKRLIKAEADNLPFKDGEFGFVWMSELLEHVDNPEKVIAEAKRVGRHGCCLFSTPMNSAFKLDPGHKVVKMEHATVATGDGVLTW